MRTHRSFLPLLGSGCLVALAVLTTGDGRNLPAAHAGPSPSTTVSVAPTTFKRKPRPGPVKAGPPPACLSARYALLSEKVPVLAAKHGPGTAAFREAYSLEKDALVGEAALRAAGCVPAGK